MATKINFSLEANVDNAVEILYSPGGVDVDLTAWTLTCQVRKNKSATTIDATLVSPTNIIISGAKFLMQFTSSIIANLNGNYVYDVVATNGSAKRKIAEGIISLDPTVTRL